MEVLTYREAAKRFNMSYSTFCIKTSRAEFEKFRIKDKRKYKRKKPFASTYYRLVNCLKITKEFENLMGEI